MKQIVLLVLMLAAALIAACSNEENTTRLTKSNKEPVSLEKLASQDTLNELKWDLEASEADVPTIISAVRSKFRTSSKTLINNKDENSVQQKLTEDFGRIIDFEILDSSADPSKVAVTENDEKIVRRVCIHTCQIQIASITLKNQGNVSTVQAFVTVEIPQEELVVTNSKLNNKKAKGLLAMYEATGNQLQLEVSMERSSRELTLTTQPFEYKSSSVGTLINFKSSDLSDYGSVRIDVANDVAVLVHEFKVDGDNLILRVNQDYGLFQFKGRQGAADASERSF